MMPLLLAWYSRSLDTKRTPLLLTILVLLIGATSVAFQALLPGAIHRAIERVALAHERDAPMGRSDLPTFPEFKWDDYFWVTSAKLPAWAGYQIRNGAYGSVSANARSDGTVQIVFAPEGRREGPLSNEEIRLVKWVIDNQTSVHDAMLERLFEEYPAMREQSLDWFDDDEAKKVLPKIRFPNQLKDIVGISSINVHQIEQDGSPFIGVELGCTWEIEHGVGILLHGDKPLEIGGADTAILLWLAKKYLSKQS